MHNLFLTGKIGIGKSTILENVLERINVSIGGYITERNIQGHIKTFTIRSLYDGVEKHTIANINTIDKSKEIFLDSFKTGIPSILDKSLHDRDLIVLDELGFMENNIALFTDKVYELLDSSKPVIGVLKDFDCEFLNSIRNRNDVIVLEITKENRDIILDNIISILKSFGVAFKDENSFMWNKRRIDWYNEALEHPNCNYPNIFIEKIKKYTGSLAGKTILDIGAGTGAFSIPFMKEGAYVTAVDSSFNMLNSLYNRAKENKLDNFNCIISPFEKSNPIKHNIAISAFSGSSTKSLDEIKKMHNLVEDYAFMIASFEKQENNFNRNVLYEMLGRPTKFKKTPNITLVNTLEMLDNYGFSYEYKKIEYELSQYFNSFDEAMHFFTNRYNIITSEELNITKKFVDEFLIETDNQYKFGNLKESFLITIKARSY